MKIKCKECKSDKITLINKKENKLKHVCSDCGYEWEEDMLSDNTYSCFEEAIDAIFEDQKRLTFKKDDDYGPMNIAEGGIFGNLIRLNDKWNRLKNLTGLNEFIKCDCDLNKFLIELYNGNINLPEPNNESIEDTIKDMINYLAYILMIKNDWWLLPRNKNKRKMTS